MMTKGQRFLEQYKAQLLELCRRYPIERLYLFGSILTDEFDSEKSDVDVQALFEPLGNHDPVERGEQMWNFWDDLESLFGGKVDLLTKPFIRNPYLRKEVESTRQLFYEGQNEEALV
ncbi:MAG: nucleotidyltransferase domain-containing protein [Saprospiraceae bacterium]